MAMIAIPRLQPPAIDGDDGMASRQRISSRVQQRFRCRRACAGRCRRGAVLGVNPRGREETADQGEYNDGYQAAQHRVLPHNDNRERWITSWQ